jgi:hypothetical protein
VTAGSSEEGGDDRLDGGTIFGSGEDFRRGDEAQRRGDRRDPRTGVAA